MKSTFKYMTLAALPVAGLLMTTPVASAYDDDWRSSSYYNDPADEHDYYHEEKGARHEDFHSLPHSKREHRRFHRNEKREHRAFHRDLDHEWDTGYDDGYSTRDWYGDRYSYGRGSRYGDHHHNHD